MLFRLCSVFLLVPALLLLSAAQDSSPDSSGSGEAPLSEGQVAQEPRVASSPGRMLVFSKTAGFRHASIPAGIACMRLLGADLGLDVVATEDAGVFSPKELKTFSVVVFLNTTGDVLDPGQQVAFESWVRSGGGWLGVHSAADTEYDWPFYAELVGAYFDSHPPVQQAVVVVEERDHPSTRMLPGLWRRTDEWYTYRMNPRPHVTVLATVDESTFTGGGMDGDHPIAWCHDSLGGRALYTGGGHTKDSYSEGPFREHLKGALRWVGGVSDAFGEEDEASPAAPAVEDASSTDS